MHDFFEMMAILWVSQRDEWGAAPKRTLLTAMRDTVVPTTRRLGNHVWATPQPVPVGFLIAAIPVCSRWTTGGWVTWSP